MLCMTIRVLHPGGICIMVCPEVDLRKVHIDLRSGKGIPPNLHI